ncbi:MAG TPA: hypothetical protein VES91_00895 [Burkholderiaceae bacterium]|nr:hypothetical protein [Burkholderiaceae bacterium]
MNPVVRCSDAQAMGRRARCLWMGRPMALPHRRRLPKVATEAVQLPPQVMLVVGWALRQAQPPVLGLASASHQAQAAARRLSAPAVLSAQCAARAKAQPAERWQ